MANRIKIVCCLSLFLIHLLGSNMGLSNPSVQLRMDYAQFRYDDNTIQVEVYYQIRQDNPSASSKTDSWVTEMVATVHKNDSLWSDNVWKNRIPIQVISGDGSGLNYTGRIHFRISEGNYRVKLAVEDSTFYGEQDSTQVQFRAVPFLGHQLSLSDIEMASSIKKDPTENTQNPFYKNGLVIQPKPDLQYHQGRDQLVYYFEMYNMVSSLASDEYLMHVVITAMDGSVLKKSPLKKYPKERIGDALAAFGELDIAGLDSGSYQLQVALYDTSGKELIHQAKIFSVAQNQNIRLQTSDVGKEDAQYMQSPFASLDPGSLKMEFNSLKYLLTGSDQAIYKNIQGDAAKRRFLYRYWLSKDPIMANPVNPSYLEFKKRLQSTNMNFKTFGKEGWKTDRGRIYITYGPPDQIERYPSSIDKAPYEIWNYDQIENGVDFIFADLTGDKSYTLIHSSKIGEVYYPDYESLIKKN